MKRAILTALITLLSIVPASAQVKVSRGVGRMSDAGRIKIRRAVFGHSLAENIGAAARERSYPAIKDLSPYWYRIQFDWSRLEPTTDDTYTWTNQDAYMIGLHDQGGAPQILGLLDDTPDWARSAGLTDSEDPPDNNSAGDYTNGAIKFAEFCTDVVTRYKPGGDFATTYGITDGWGVTYWEIRNEINKHPASGIWLTGTIYYENLSRCYNAIKAVDSNAKILGTSMDDSSAGNAVANNYRRLYATGIQPYFDILSMHTYDTTGSDPCLSMYQDEILPTRKVMAQYGDAGKPVWVTEYGKSEAGRTSMVNCTNRNLDQAQSQQYEQYFQNSFRDDTSDEYGMVARTCGEVASNQTICAANECGTTAQCTAAPATGSGKGTFTSSQYYGFKNQVIY